MPDGMVGRAISPDLPAAAAAPIFPQTAPPGAPPLVPGFFAVGGLSVAAPGFFAGGAPVGGPASIFQIGGAPVAVLGGVFSGGLPLAGPVTQIFRGGSAPVPPTLFAATLTPAGPIGGFFIGTGGAPIGVEVFGGGPLPIGPVPQIVQEVQAIGPRTAFVGANPAIGLPPPAVAFGGAEAAGAARPIGGLGVGS